MVAIPNKIVIGDEASPIMTITNENIKSVSEESAVSLIGDELFIDQFVPIVRYGLSIRYVFVPTDYDSFVTKDGLTLCGYYNYDLRSLPYGTKITFYTNNRISGVFYSENVERTGKELFKINAISAIGLMNRQRSKGGIYTGQTFNAVLREIVGEEYEYTINEDVAALQVYGWLPYSTRRRNLHQLIMAYGVNIIRSDNGGMLFTFLGNTTPQEIPSNRIFSGGKVTYNDPASRVEVVEHAYHYVESVAEETLFDNTSSDTVSHAVITFDKPIYTASLRVLDGGNLTISSSGVNYAVVSGTGVLVGKPYVHTTKIVSMDNEEATKEKVVRVEEATLVTLTNSENVLARVAEYYFNATTVENSIIVDTEKCGRRYATLNAFHEYVSGFISKMSTTVSSFRKATCEIIADYVPRGQGSAYTHIVTLPDASGTWTVPEEVFEKTVPNIRVVLIGGGEAGTSGAKGEDGEAATVEQGTTSTPARGTVGNGGAGGIGGVGGAGGKVLSTTIDCTGISSFSYGRNGLNTFFLGGAYSLNSANGVSSETGFVEIFSGTIYALPGHAGQNGGAGGKGGLYAPPGYGEGSLAENGEDVTYNGRTYKGGVGGSREIGAAASATNDWYYGGGGASGAAVGANGKNGGRLDGGNGAVGAIGDDAIALFGCGGNGGNGGGGAGGGGVGANYNWKYTHWVGALAGAGGTGGDGGAGSEGYQGGIIIYY